MICPPLRNLCTFTFHTRTDPGSSRKYLSNLHQILYIDGSTRQIGPFHMGMWSIRKLFIYVVYNRLI